MTGKPQDFPTGEGYWAFEGHLIDLPDIQYRELTEVFTIKDRLVANLKDRGAWPVEWLIGTFTRVYMPWEQQPPPTEPGRYLFDGYRTTASGNRARVAGWLDWPDDDGATYEGRWMAQQPAPSVPDAVRAAIYTITDGLGDAEREFFADELEAIEAWLDEQGGGSDGC